MIDEAHHYFMKEALALAKKAADEGEVPIGAVIVHEGKIIAVGTQLGSVILLNAETGEELPKLLSHGTETVTAVAFDPEGTILVSAGKDRVIKLWDVASFEPFTLPPAHTERIWHAGFSSNGRLLVTTGGATVFDKLAWTHQGEVCLWDVTSKKLLTTFRSHYGCVTSAIFGPDGKTLATTGRDGKVNLWDVDELLKHGSESKSPAEERPSSGKRTE